MISSTLAVSNGVSFTNLEQVIDIGSVMLAVVIVKCFLCNNGVQCIFVVRKLRQYLVILISYCSLVLKF